jgi:hypothetical protein
MDSGTPGTDARVLTRNDVFKWLVRFSNVMEIERMTGIEGLRIKIQRPTKAQKLACGRQDI